MTPDVLTTALGHGNEFDIIRDLLARWSTVARGIGDDAAILRPSPDERLVISTDASIQNVHFRPGWLNPREIGWRAVAAAVSDLAAMAAEPVGMLIAFGLPVGWRGELAFIAEGIRECAVYADIPIIGGNISRAGELSITTTVIGRTQSPLRRSTMSAGDRIYVTGRLGGPAAALRELVRGEPPEAPHRARYAHPLPRIREARWLAEHGASAGIDISDGLVADLRHLAAASGGRIILDLDRVPRVTDVTPEEAAESGEEYEMIVSSAEGFDTAAFEAEFGVPLTEIGRTEPGPPVVDAMRDGERVAPLGGHDHFSS